MVEFTYNNTKNVSIGYTLFELNFGYHPCVSYKKDVNLYSKSKSADEPLIERSKLIIIYKDNLHQAKKLQNRADDKAVKPKSYTLSNKVQLNNKYIKNK